MNTIYNYREAMEEDIREYINDNYNIEDFDAAINDIYEKLYDELLVEDSVTGNASGSYTFNSALAKQYVMANMGLLCDTCEEFCINGLEKIANDEWEYLDVSIRCYLLGIVLRDVIEEIQEPINKMYM